MKERVGDVVEVVFYSIAVVFVIILGIFAAIKIHEIPSVENFYVSEGMIVCLDFDENITTIETTDGNLWESIGIEKTYKEGQKVFLIMNNNKTWEIWDDEIIKIC